MPKLFLLGITEGIIPKSKVTFVCNLITAAQLIIAKNWKSSDYISVDDWLGKHWEILKESKLTHTKCS